MVQARHAAWGNTGAQYTVFHLVALTDTDAFTVQLCTISTTCDKFFTAYRVDNNTVLQMVAFFHCNGHGEMRNALEKGTVNLRLLAVDPRSDACLQYGRSVREEETIRQQVAHNLDLLMHLKKSYRPNNGPLQVKLYDTVPHASFIHVIDKKNGQRQLYYSPYRFATPGRPWSWRFA